LDSSAKGDSLLREFGRHSLAIATHEFLNSKGARFGAQHFL
jgi:hypothetical protein